MWDLFIYLYVVCLKESWDNTVSGILNKVQLGVELSRNGWIETKV